MENVQGVEVYMENRRFCLRAVLIGIGAAAMFAGLCGGCGYSREEKRRMEEIARLGEENAETYVMEKYGFAPVIESVELCTELGDSDPVPWAEGYVLVRVRQGEQEFKVHISGEEPSVDGRDDFQRALIEEEGREFFENLLGYEVYDVYLEYGEDGMLGERYEAGTFEAFLRNHPMNVRIDDCTDRDLTEIREENPGAAAFLEECARDCGTKFILISYKSREDYDRGYDHTYGRGGVMDFEIWNDSLYINSYGVFEGEKRELNRFELQELDGVIFGCIDRSGGDDLEIGTGRRQWMELGETRGEPVLRVYSVDRDAKGEVAVFLPTELYGQSPSVFIQHVINGNEWRQYEAGRGVTRDKRYVFVTYHGIPDCHFDLAVFNGGSR